MKADIERKHIVGLSKGSYKDFQILYDHYAPMLYGFSLKMTKSTEESREIVQTTFMKIWELKERLREDTSFKSFLFTTTKNYILNCFRDNMKNQLFDDYMLFTENERISGNNVDDHIYLEDIKKHLSKAKEKLSPRQLEIFEKSKELGMDNTEIAQSLNISEQSVRNQLSASLKIIRTMMTDLRTWIIVITLFMD